MDRTDAYFLPRILGVLFSEMAISGFVCGGSWPQHEVIRRTPEDNPTGNAKATKILVAIAFTRHASDAIGVVHAALVSFIGWSFDSGPFVPGRHGLTMS